MKKITSIKELREQIDKGNHRYYIAMGFIRSSKYITRSEFNKDDFFIMNESDATEQLLTESQIFDREYTNIGYAMERGAFYMDRS